MTTLKAGERSPRRSLRLWPGVVAVVVLGLARFGVKAVIPGFKGFALGMQWALGAALAVVLWWLFFSRARWFDRVGAIVLIIGGLSGTWYLRHESMGPAWLFAYVLPILCFAFVAWAAASHGLANGPRRVTMAWICFIDCTMSASRLFRDARARSIQFGGTLTTLERALTGEPLVRSNSLASRGMYSSVAWVTRSARGYAAS
jgi:hypothetical protein